MAQTLRSRSVSSQWRALWLVPLCGLSSWVTGGSPLCAVFFDAQLQGACGAVVQGQLGQVVPALVGGKFDHQVAEGVLEEVFCCGVHAAHLAEFPHLAEGVWERYAPQGPFGLAVRSDLLGCAVTKDLDVALAESDQV